MRTPLLMAAVIALLFVGGAADAGAYGWRVERSLAIAEHVFRPACDVRVTWGPPNPHGVTGFAWANTDQCMVVLRDDIPLTGPHFNVDERTGAFAIICTTIMDEVGHLAGDVHRGDQRSLLWRADPRCANRGRPYLERAGLLSASL